LQKSWLFLAKEMHSNFEVVFNYLNYLSLNFVDLVLINYYNVLLNISNNLINVILFIVFFSCLVVFLLLFPIKDF